MIPAPRAFLDHATAEFDPREMLRECQRISACGTTDEILEVAATAVVKLAGAAACTVSTHSTDGRADHRFRVAHHHDEIVHVALPESEGDPPGESGIVTMSVEVDKCQVAFRIELARAAPTLDEQLAPLLEQVRIGLRHTLLYAELESLVMREVQTSVEREQAIRLVLDSMHDGLLVCELDGRLSDIRSRTVSDTFGEPTANQRVWDYLGAADPHVAFALQLAWDSLAANLLPFDLALAQVPSQLVRGERTLQLAFQPVYRAGDLGQVVVSVRDVTDELAATRAHELAHELATVVTRYLADREGFYEFLDEAHHQLRELESCDDERVQARILHTLKGNAAQFGLSWFAGRCHAVEDELAVGATLDGELVARLRTMWDQALEPVRPFLGERDRNEVSLHKDELLACVQRLRVAGVDQKLVEPIDEWTVEPIGPALQRLARQAEQIAARQGKKVTTSIEGERVRIADRFRKLLPPVVHAVRNAIDHGIEPVTERVQQGKSPAGQLSVSCSKTATELVLTVSDDGRGIDWERVRSRAQSLGVHAETREQLVETLFHDGLSTSTEVTEISGRGVGMGALRAICQELGGSIIIDSSPHQGTRVTCIVPMLPADR